MSGFRSDPSAVWALDLPPENDRLFDFAVLARIERRRFSRNLLWVIAGLFASLCALVVVAPALEISLQEVARTFGTADIGVWSIVAFAMVVAIAPGVVLGDEL